MIDQRAFQVIPGGYEAPSSAVRRPQEKARPTHLRLVTAEFVESVRDGHEPEGLRPLRRPDDVALRLADWSEAAREAGHAECADRLCLMAWEAYDRPARKGPQGGSDAA